MFFIGRIAFPSFSVNCNFKKFLGVTEIVCCRNSVWLEKRKPLYFPGAKWICYGRSIVLGNTKKGQNLHFTMKTLVFRNIWFYRPLRCRRDESKTGTKVFKKPCRLLDCVPSGLWFVMIRRMNGQEFFFNVRIAFPFFSVNCIFNRFLGVTQKIFYLEQ